MKKNTAIFHPAIVKPLKKISSPPYSFIQHPEKPYWAIVNSMGYEILSLCDGNHSIDDISAELTKRYDVSEDALKNDIADFISYIEKSGLLENEPQAYQPVSYGLKSLFIHITDTCNLQCMHCYAYKNKKDRRELSDNVILDCIKQLYAAGGTSVTLSGGEPLIRKDLVNKIIHASEHISNNTLTILTNGILIDEEMATRFKQNNVTVQVSLDGPNSSVHDSIRGKGTFKRTLEGIQKLIHAGMKNNIVLCTTIMKNNAEGLTGILDLAKRLDITKVRFLPVRKKGSASSGWNEISSKDMKKLCEQFYDFVYTRADTVYPGISVSSGLTGFTLDTGTMDCDKDFQWCPVGTNLVIDTNGDVYPCVLLMEDCFRLGTVPGDTLDTIMKSDLLADLLKTLSERRKNIRKCSTCRWNAFCQAGCMGLAFENHGTLLKSDQFCTYRKKLYTRSVEKLLKRAPHPTKKSDPHGCF